MNLPKLATFIPLAALAAIACEARPVTGRTSSGTGCDLCHGFPPPPPAGDHIRISNPEPSDCSPCHSSTVAPDGTIVAGGTHNNQTVDALSSPHAAGFATPSAHGYAAEAAIGSCTSCHGTEYQSCTPCHADAGFADWRTNCTFCHGTQTQNYTGADLASAAPPEGVQGQTLTTQPEVGAHQKHLLGGGVLSDGIACGECHLVPSDLSHLNGTAAVSFGTLARQGTPGADYAGGQCASVYCHGATLNGGSDTTPTWVGSVACGQCHGNPPLTGKHDFHVNGEGYGCAVCHNSVAAAGLAIAIKDDPTARQLHVNGSKDVSFSTPSWSWDPVQGRCQVCHGTSKGTWY